jgi:ubiquinone/menaquinone biosynthesis C-methylase UbiE
MPATLHLESGQEHRIETREPDLWVEVGARGEYSDIGNDAERELLAELKTGAWEEVVARRFADQNPWLYKIITDRGRSLFLDFLPLREGGSFLDVGAGWGQVAIPLSRFGNVFCLDVTLPRLLILREVARQEQAALRYICGNFSTFPFASRQFDTVIFNGSLEWITLGTPGDGIWTAQKAALQKAQRILRRGGLVYVGIENSLGLKYLLGAPDDHTGIPYLTFLSEEAAEARFQSEQGRRLPAKTWSLAEYRTLFEGAGLSLRQVYGCFPDYKLIRSMIPLEDVNAVLAESDLPCPEYSGRDGAPLPFTEQLHHLYRLLARNRVAQYFCPSYGLIAEKPS